MAILYENLLCGLGPAQSIRAFQYDRIVVHGVHVTTSDSYPLTTIDIKAVTIGVCLNVLYQKVVNTCEQHREMTAFQETDIADGDMMAIAQSQGLVGHRHPCISTLRLTPIEHIRPVYQPFALDGQMMQMLSPEQGVVPMAVTEVLIVRIVRLCLVIAFAIRYWSSLQHSARFQSQSDVTLQMNGVAEVDAFWHNDGIATVLRSRFNRSIDGRRVYTDSIAHRSESFDVDLSLDS